MDMDEAWQILFETMQLKGHIHIHGKREKDEAAQMIDMKREQQHNLTDWPRL